MRVKGNISPNVLNIESYAPKAGHVEVRLRDNINPIVETDEMTGQEISMFEYDEYTFVLPDREGLREDIEANMADWLVTGRTLEVTVRRTGYGFGDNVRVGFLNMSKENIYMILRDGGLTHAGAIAMMGNIMAESSLKSTIVQRGMQSLSDADYTAMADSGSADWLKPVGYGLCQWTLAGRKNRLREFAQAQGVSVGDETMQCRFALKELREDFSKLFNYLTSERCEVNEACDWICREFENPAVKNYSVRRAFAAEFDYLKDGFATDANVPSKPVTEVSTVKDPVIFCLQLLMSYDGYWDVPDGLRSSAWKSKFKEWSTDILNT